MKLSGKPWEDFLDHVDGKAREDERRLWLIRRFEGGRGGSNYRCKHAVVSSDGAVCLICGEAMPEAWTEAWLETGVHSASRPHPRDYVDGEQERVA